MPIKIIPVLDLKDDCVVHAVRGNRNAYKPLSTSLSSSIEPNDLCAVFLDEYGFDTVYIADLNAIMNEGDQQAIIKNLLLQYPGMNIWLDSGLHFIEDKQFASQYFPILGTETNINALQFDTIKQRFPNIILSLDYSNADFLGDPDIVSNPSTWPENIILMNLDTVGSQQGLNRELIRSVQSLLSNNQQLYIAGGIRNQADIEELESLGIKGVLVSTALHNLSLKPNL